MNVGMINHGGHICAITGENLNHYCKGFSCLVSSAHIGSNHKVGLGNGDIWDDVVGDYFDG